MVEGAVDIIYRTMAETGLVHDEGLIRIRDLVLMFRASVRHQVYILNMLRS